MKRKLGLLCALVLIVLTLPQIALAESCYFTFTANGKTYFAAHYPDEGYYECFNQEVDTSPSFNDWSDEYHAYVLAFDAAKDAHAAICTNLDLGDERIPVPMLCGGLILAAFSALLVHRQRQRIH